MERLTHERSNGIKTGYWSPNKKDELIERLAAYENTGLTPQEIYELKAGMILKMMGRKWIPVEEKLPEPGKKVRATVKHSEWISDYGSAWVPAEEKIYHPESYSVYKAEYIGGGIWRFFSEDGEWVYCDAVEKTERDPGTVYDTVIAWMPIPEPYRYEE